MLEDVNAGIAWTLAHAEEHGGDPQHTYLVGQSCGAQLAALSLVTQVPALDRPTACPGRPERAFVEEEGQLLGSFQQLWPSGRGADELC